MAAASLPFSAASLLASVNVYVWIMLQTDGSACLCKVFQKHWPERPIMKKLYMSFSYFIIVTHWFL